MCVFVCLYVRLPLGEDEEDEEVRSYRTEGGGEWLQQLDVPTETPRTSLHWTDRLAVSQFRVCILQRTLPLWSSKASPSERQFWPRQLLLNGIGLAFGAFPGYFTISTAQARKSDDLHHAMSPLSLFLLFRTCKESWDVWGQEGQ